MRSIILVALIVTAAAATITRESAPEGYVAVPGGRYAHHTCIHSVPDGSVIEKQDTQKAAITGLQYTVRTPTNRVLAIPKCKHALVTRAHSKSNRRSHSGHSARSSLPTHGIAWIVDGLQDNSGAGNGFSYFGTNFTVPNAPTNPSDVLIYFWPGLEDEAMSDVLQPVLQYGEGPYGGGNYWVYQSWFVSSDGTVLVGSQVGPIATGTGVFGSITSSTDRTQYTSTAVVEGMSQTSVLTIAKTEAQLQTRAYLTVEIYNLDDCSQTPPDNSLAFNDIVLRDGNGKSVAPNFTPEVQNEACSFKVVPAGSEVSLVWQSS